jgi:hypothetical protein
MKTFLLLPPDPNEPDEFELTAEEKQELVEDMRCFDERDVFEALTKAWRPEDLIELAKLIFAHTKIEGRAQ